MRCAFTFRAALLASLALSAINVQADLSTKQARRLITRMAGFELPNSTVRVKRITSPSDSSAEATAELQTAFRLTTNDRGRWRVAEVRTGPNRWEPPDLLAGAESSDDTAIVCDGPDLSNRARSNTEPTTKGARCLIADLLAVQLPSDAVRIKSISPMAVPLTSKPSALVEAVISLDLRFARNAKTGWVVSAVRTGSRDWVNPETIVAATNERKRTQAQADLESMARGLARFWAERHSYVVSDSHAVLVDHLSPRYLSRVIRLDPWHEPYHYQGEQNRFTLRSAGADRKENTADDVVVSSPSR